MSYRLGDVVSTSPTLPREYAVIISQQEYREKTGLDAQAKPGYHHLDFGDHFCILASSGLYRVSPQEELEALKGRDDSDNSIGFLKRLV